MNGQTIEYQTNTPSTGNQTFLIACWLCGLIGFIQIVMLGVALASRAGETRIVTKTVEQAPDVYYIPTLVDQRNTKAKLKPRSMTEIMAKYGNADTEITSLTDKKRTPTNQRSFGVEIRPNLELQQQSKRFGRIRNTQVEKLVEDAYKLHFNGDVVRAILKLDEAEKIDPSEPAVIYRRALIYEDMRNWERATDAYDALFSMGPEIGNYYKIAADKIANGVKDPPDTVPFQLGNVIQKISPDKLDASITIPIRRITEREVEPSQLDIRIFFYDIVDNKSIEPVPKQREQNISKRWLTGVADWNEGIEESIEANYSLPQLSRANVHLFGERKYFGQVIEIYYKGELMDQFASPGRLHGIHAAEQYKQQTAPGLLPFDFENYDGEGTELLLPEIE